MNAKLLSEALPQPSSLSGPSPILVFGSSDAARKRGTEAVIATGYRFIAALPIDQAVARLDQQGSTSAVWIELDRDDGAPLDSLLERVDREASTGHYAAIVATEAALIDPVEARLRSGSVDLLIDADAIERTAALALALNTGQSGRRLSDVRTDNSAARLRQLSDEVGRIAASLATLSRGPSESGLPGRIALAPMSSEPAPEVSRDALRAVIRARRVRARFFAEELFADPAWDMLLDLMHAELAQIRVPVSSLCIAAAVPATTALRWIKTLNDRGLITRRADPHDGRRVFVELSSDASESIRRYFGEVGQLVGV